MFKKTYVIVILMLVMILSSCGVSPNLTVTASPTASRMPVQTSAAPTAATDVAVIRDPVLEKAIRFAISKPSGELTDEDLNSIQALSYFGNDEIKSLDGIDRLANLQKLDIENASLVDIAPLTGLKNLTSLTLKNNLIRDISPVKELKNLQTLDLSINLIENIEPVSGLANLTDLKLDFNRITDLSPLKGLTALQNLSLPDNRVSDIRALGSLKGLQALDLDGNYKIRDFSALTGLENIQRITVDFFDKSDIDILKSYKNLTAVSFFGYNEKVDPKAAGAKIDLSKYYETMDAADSILGSVIKPGMSDYEKEFAIFTYVQSHVRFGSVANLARTNYSAYGGLIRKMVECQGFAYTQDLLMKKAGVYCVSIHGGGHFWNLIQLDDGWYQVDASRSVSSASDFRFFNMNDEMAQKLEDWDTRYFPACNGSKYLYKQN